MKLLSVQSLVIPEIKVIRFARFSDVRGYFTEPFRWGDLRGCADAAFLHDLEFPQINESWSRAGVIRGLHFQWNPYMGKLVRTIAGRMIDLVLDIRKGSPTLGRIIAYDMPSSREDSWGEWIWVPPGFAHGNLFPEATCIEYLCSGEYSPGCEAGICPLADDLDWSLCEPALKTAFDAHVANSPTISEKDRGGLSLAQWLDDSRSEQFVWAEGPRE
jgi:dTDP-4-dehydrorhamnose 3,5-epimerase